MTSQRTCVWLSSEQVVWSLWSNETLVDCVVVCVDERARCPWDVRGAVRMVVDAGHEDVERIASTGFGSDVIGRWQRLLFAHRRRLAIARGRDLEQAAESATEPGPPLSQQALTPAWPLSWLSRNGSETARGASVIECWSDPIHAWLRAALHNGLVVAEVYSAARLLARCATSDSTPQLLVFDVAGVSRHLVCADGVVCLTRTVAENEDQLEAVAAAIEHVAERWGFHRLNVSLPFNTQIWTPNVVANVQTLCKGMASVRSAVPIDVPAYRADTPVLDSLIFETLKALNTRHTSIRFSGAISHVAQARAASEPRRAHRTQLGLRCAMIALALLALSSASYAVAVGVAHARLAAASIHERESVFSDARQTWQRASDLTMDPVRATRRVQRAIELNRSQPASPNDVLVLVATHIDRHPHLLLHQLEWRSLADDDSQFEQVLVSDGPVHVMESPWQASLLAEFPEASPVLTLVELAGVTQGIQAVTEAQKAADSLQQSLQAVTRVRSCNMLLSPLMMAAEGPEHQLNESPLPWRMRCILNAPEVRSGAVDDGAQRP